MGEGEKTALGSGHRDRDGTQVVVGHALAGGDDPGWGGKKVSLLVVGILFH
jgi:hypothetical protein